ncbi:replication initiation protein [Chenggangzhangella methanolivorans]|uniref:Replication initiation protein n=1 Tax=Chenggangzhangella methanolivorans TaxID=1437009 RepID=A0A9E6RDP5_9HYPH|nr:replication initiation protein [Chenggangzhangella methanolivorans]
MAALPRFKSKFTARLYARLARRAGFSADKRRPWSIAPERLAEDLGWNYKGYGPFKLRVLDKSVAEINQHVRRFGVTLREETAARGKVTAIVFETFERERRADEQQVTIFENARALDALGGADPAHVGDLIPEDGWVLRVAKALDVRPADLAHGWRAALDEARLGVFREDLPEATPADLAGQELLDAIEEDGLDAAFEIWAGGAAHTGRHLDGAQANRVAREEAVREAIVRLDREWEIAEAVTIRLARKGDDNEHVAAAAQRVIAWPWSEGRPVHVTVVVPGEGEDLHYDLSTKSLPKAAVTELRAHPGVASVELMSVRPAAATAESDDSPEAKAIHRRRTHSSAMLEYVASKHCTPDMVPDLIDPEQSVFSLALRELPERDAEALRKAFVRLRRPLSYAIDDAMAEDPRRIVEGRGWGMKVIGLSEKAKATLTKWSEAYFEGDLKKFSSISWAVVKSVHETKARPCKAFGPVRLPKPTTVSHAPGEETEMVLDA